MELIRGIHNLRPRHRGCVATIGNFDGVHLGHQAVLGQLAEKAAKLHLPALVIIFEPLPHEFFAAATAPPRLTRLREKLLTLRRFSVDHVLCLRFDARLAGMRANDFITHILVEALDVRYLVLGDDFRFGKDREGNFSMLQAQGRAHGFQVVNMPTFQVERQRVSSTRIREALQRGDLATAEKLLGRPYRLCGRIRRGDRRGRILGFPTANLALGWPPPPVKGIFAVRVFGLENKPLNGVASIGNRPTFNGTDDRLEVYLLDFKQDIYGRHLQVELLQKLRDEERFESLEALKKQIEHDVDAAKQFFGRQ
ncbi:MAG TPA: bifunctional riboflavin kinase/FAD synthetase [Gammaproteobacteria bacterium]|jgi:riboflavin kinase/FMN adenylyltransferase|nr:bifunctional riboflavin kinase/FAD synthetase [Gammaproteobacteria bacterium]